jgi:hypothetical protein
MTLILGPADASHFRVKVGRYGERWYCDPLPGDDIAPAADPDAAWPAISTIKRASGNDWSFVAMKRIAHAADAELERLPTLAAEQRYDTCKSINSHGLNVAAGRGTIVHWWGEDLLHGRPPRAVTPLDLTAARLPAESLTRALLYLPALQQFFDTYQPELVAAEYPVIHRDLNGVGYGGTPDGIWRIGGDLYLYDFKTRTEDGDHAAYPEEAAQIAAGARADYMLVEGVDGAERRHIPDVVGGMVVSIKPDGCRIYPVDIDKAFDHFTALHAWWVARRAEREPIGRPWPVKAAKKGVTMTNRGLFYLTKPPLERDEVATRARALVDAGHGARLAAAWPDGIPGLATDHQHTPDELAQIAAAVHSVEVDTDAPFTVDDQTLDTPRHAVLEAETGGPDTSGIDEGPDISDDEYEVLRVALGLLPDDGIAKVEQVVAEAHAAHVPISLRQRRSRRRYLIARALVDWATAMSLCEADLYELVECVRDSPLVRDTPLGAAIGALTLEQAQQLADMVAAPAA